MQATQEDEDASALQETYVKYVMDDTKKNLLFEARPTYDYLVDRYGSLEKIERLSTLEVCIAFALCLLMIAVILSITYMALLDQAALHRLISGVILLVLMMLAHWAIRSWF